MTYQLHTTYKKLLADTYTPVSIYLKLRDKFPNSILLESSDYRGYENSFSYICCQPIASIKVENKRIYREFPDGKLSETPITKDVSITDEIQKFSNAFKATTNDFKFINNGLFGYIAYDSIRYFEELELQATVKEDKQIPDILYSIYQFVIAIDHYKNEIYLFEHSYSEPTNEGIERLEGLIANKNFNFYPFQIKGTENSNFTDDEFVSIITKGKEHCQKGQVSQIVLSREFSQSFQGDDFNVYRALRSINPSPYLFYFDYGNFKIFGSSPEAQLVVKNGKAEIHPIAGTFKRTGNDEADAELAEKLKLDAKENAEHLMLVELAQNDLESSCTDVKVETFREVQFYSHVIHLVSKVTGKLKENSAVTQLIANTFPAGTLSGTPKRAALELIDQYEKNNRGFYGGCIGFLGFDGSFNAAIMIRSFLSKNNTLHYQAGAGVVESSNEQNELNEVYNKLAALKKAIDLAQKI